jgi:hypothetical protein
MKSCLRMRRTWRKWSGHHSLRGHCESRIASRLDVATKEAAAEAAAEAVEAAVSFNTVNHFSHNFIGDSLGLIPSPAPSAKIQIIGGKVYLR